MHSWKRGCARSEIPFSRLPRGVQNGWTTIVENLDTYMGNLVSKISEPTVTAAGNFAKRLPSYLISFIVAILAAYFFTIQREEVIAWFHKIAPPSVEKRMILVMDNLKYSLCGFGCISDFIFGFPAIFWNGNCVDPMGNLLRIYR